MPNEKDKDASKGPRKRGRCIDCKLYGKCRHILKHLPGHNPHAETNCPMFMPKGGGSTASYDS